MGNIKQYQEDMKKEQYNHIKNAILSNVRIEIKNNPNIDSINYYKDTSFRVGMSPIWIYNKIDTWFDDLSKDLKEEGITLKKIEVHTMRETGIFKKKIIKEFNYDYYNLSWS